MIQRVPPRLASWLLRQWGSAYYGESLAGDLVEQYQQGRSAAWYWRQVAAAILIARARFIRTMAWTPAVGLLARFLAETAAMLAIITGIDQARRSHSPAGMMTAHFIGTVAVLMTVVLMSIGVAMWSARRRGHAAINAMLLAFGVIALGAGTLTWADTRDHAC